MTTAPSAPARNATRATPVRSRLPGCPPRAASATWAPTTRRWRSTTSRSTASCSPRSAICCNLDADPRTLTTRDMFVPTCATCHMSGINGLKVTHNPSDRLSWYLADAVSTHRPNYLQAQINMKQVCTQCHTQALVDRVYTQAEQVVASTNAKVLAAKAIMDGLHKDGVAHRPAIHPAHRLHLLQPLALRRPHQQARRVHGRRRLRAVAWQLRAAGEDRRTPARRRRAAERACPQIILLAAHARKAHPQPTSCAGRTTPSSGSSCSSPPTSPFSPSTFTLRTRSINFESRRVHSALFLNRRAGGACLRDCFRAGFGSCDAPWRDVGYLVGWLAILVGLARRALSP